MKISSQTKKVLVPLSKNPACVPHIFLPVPKGRVIFKSGYPVGGFFKGSEKIYGKFKGYEIFPEKCKGYENFLENCKGYEIFNAFFQKGA